jgi:DNA-binding XRE family transcriptional regulator
MDPLEVAQALRRRRRLAMMTQADVARAMGSTQSSVSRAESGRVMPSVRFLERYAWATGRMLSIDIGPPARMRGEGGVALGYRSVVEPDDGGDPVAEAVARHRAARERLERGEISYGEHALEELLAEFDLLETRRAPV